MEFDTYQLSFDEVSRCRVAVNSKQRSTVAPRHETERNLVFAGRRRRPNLKSCNAKTPVSTVSVAVRLWHSSGTHKNAA